MTGLSQPAATGDVRDQEFEARLASIKVGAWLSALVCLGAAVYALGTWDQPNREPDPRRDHDSACSARR